MIISIIILIILAAVSINTIIETSILDKTSEGVLEYSYAEYEEVIEEAIWDGLLNTFISTGEGVERVYTQMPTQIVAELENQGFTVTDTEGKNPTEEDGTIYEYTIKKSEMTFYLTIDTSTGKYSLTSDLDESE